ncbi:MAG TPA: peptidylprolyl isomerase [Alphaproteobacteria bacterium]
MMKLLSALLLGLLVVMPSWAKAQSPRAGIAAIVNDDIITNSDVMSRVNLAIQGARMQPDAQVLQQIINQALQALVEEQIRLSEAKRLNIKIDDKEIDEGFAKLAAQNNLPPEQFAEILSRGPGALDSIRRQIRTQIAWGKIVKQKLRPQINVGDTDIDNYLAEQARNKGKMEYETAEIFLRTHNGAEDAGALKMAQDIVTQLRSHKQRFSVLAKQFSQGSEANKGGLLGWVTEGRLDPALDNTLKTLKIGETSDPIKMSDGYHILFLKDKREILSVEQQSQQLQIKQLFMPAPPQAPPAYQQQAFETIKSWQQQAVDCTSMQNLIKANPSPISKDLGMVHLSDLPPPVAAVVRDAPIGKAIEPLRGSDGFLMVMVCGREDAGDDESIRTAAANEIGSERLNRLQRRYFRDLKDAAYIDIKKPDAAPAPDSSVEKKK